MRYFINTIKTIALICGLLLLAFVIINWGDEELKPEVAQALAWKPPHNAFEDNGYLILLGIEAPAEMSATQVGTRMLKAELARYVSTQKNHKETPAPEPNPAEVDDYIDWKDNRCKYEKQQNCVDFYLQQGADKLSFVMLLQERLTARYNEICGTKSYVEVIPPLVTSQFPKYSLLTQASELERIQAIFDISQGKLEQGVTKFTENAAFSRRLLLESNSLISHMIALSMMQRDTRILSELMIKYPKIVTQYAAQLMPVLAPISTPEFGFKKSLTYERDMTLQVMNSLKHTTKNELNAILNEMNPNKTHQEKLYIKIGYQPNATVNLFYDSGALRMQLAESEAQHFDANIVIERVKQRELMGLGLNFFHIKNQVGKILAEVAEPDFAKYIERQYDLDGYIYMVNFQLTTILNKLEIKKLGLHDPYKKPMQYDANSGVLTFAGRQPSSGNFNKSNIYQVKLH